MVYIRYRSSSSSSTVVQRNFTIVLLNHQVIPSSNFQKANTERVLRIATSSLHTRGKSSKTLPIGFNQGPIIFKNNCDAGQESINNYLTVDDSNKSGGKPFVYPLEFWYTRPKESHVLFFE